VTDGEHVKGVIEAIRASAQPEHKLLATNSLGSLLTVLAYLLSEAQIIEVQWPWIALFVLSVAGLFGAAFWEVYGYLRRKKRSTFGKRFIGAYAFSVLVVAMPVSWEQLKDLPDIQVLSKEVVLRVHDNGSADVVTARTIKARRTVDKVVFWGMESDSSTIEGKKVSWNVRDLQDGKWRPTSEVTCEHDSRKKLTSVILPNPLQAGREYELTCSTVFERSYPKGVQGDYLRANVNYPTGQLKVTVQFDETRKIASDYTSAGSACISQILERGGLTSGTCYRPENITPSLLQFVANNCQAGDLYFLEWIYQNGADSSGPRGVTNSRNR